MYVRVIEWWSKLRGEQAAGAEAGRAALDEAGAPLLERLLANPRATSLWCGHVRTPECPSPRPAPH